MKTSPKEFKCIVCNNNNCSTAFDDRGFRVLECDSCRFGIVDPIPGEEELNRLYNSAEYFATHMQYDYENIQDEQIEKLVTQTGKFHERYLSKYLTSNARILEIGTGGGFALKYFKNKGYTVTGVETSTASVIFAKERLGIDIKQVPFEDFKENALFDVIILNHVLEHFTNLPGVMKLIVSKLNKGGILYVRVPNHDSYDRRVFKLNWPAYLPFHISYFSKKSLVKLFDNFGIEVLETDEYISEKFLSGIPRSLSNFVKKVVRSVGLTKYFNGRTITIIGKLK